MRTTHLKKSIHISNIILWKHIKKSILLAIPVVINQLGHIMVGVADSMMVGKVGIIPLAAATFANTFYHILMLFGIGVSYAITPLVASTHPLNNKILFKYLSNALILNFLLGVGLLIISYVCSYYLDMFGQDQEVVLKARPYLIIMSFSFLPLMVFQTFRQYLEGLSDTFNPMIISIIANLINVGLNYLLIYGKFGFPALELNGAGYASLIARVVMVLLILILLKNKWKGIFIKINWKIINKLLKIGIPSGLQYIFEIGAFALATIMVGWLGAKALAAHNIALNLAAISYMAASGLSAASCVRIGNQMRMKNKKNLRMIGMSSFGLVVFFMTLCGLFFIIFRNILPSLYVSDTQVIAMSSTLLMIAAAFQISDGIQVVGLGVLRGLSDVKVPTLVTFFAYWIVAIPCGYIFCFIYDWGINGIWYALFIGLTLSGISHIWRFHKLTIQMRFS